MRYPRDASDSAYIGLRMIPNEAVGPPNYTYYKEYVQSSLIEPLGTGIYRVSFLVSRSKYSTMIKKMCALFTETSYVNPVPQFPFPENPYGGNLYVPFSSPREFITNPQICSDEDLYMTADANGQYGWQEISGTLYVDDTTTYNYITIGNFQRDSLLNEDTTHLPGAYPDLIYYFIDNVKIEPILSPEECVCYKEIFLFNVKQNKTNSDSTKCCYDYEITLREDLTSVANPFCPVTQIKLMKGNVVAFDTVSSDPFYHDGKFNGHTFSGSFCLDNFPDDDGFFTLHFYQVPNDPSSELGHCSRNVFLNCLCDCSDQAEQKHKLKMRMEKVDDSENGNCCWDLVLENPTSTDSASCVFDLSNIHFVLKSENDMSIDLGYDLTPASGFTYDYHTNYNWKAPDNFRLKTGESVVFGRICSDGIPQRVPFNVNDLNIHILMSTSAHHSSACDTLLSAFISCDSIADCCETVDLSAHVSWGNYYGSSGGSGGGGLGGDVNNVHYSSCLAGIKLHFQHNMYNCGYNDEIFAQVYDSTNTVLLNKTFKVNELDNFVLELSKLSFSGQKTFCVAFKNLVTLDSCYKCITLNCPRSPLEVANKQNEYDLNESIDDNNDELIVKPNPFESSCEVQFNSQKGLNLEVSLNDILGRSILTYQVTSTQGLNKIIFSNLELPSGVYHLSVKFPNKILTKQVMIVK